MLSVDVDGNGTAEIAVGLGDAGLALLDHEGRELWYRETQFGTPGSLATWAATGDGTPVLLAGLGILSGTAECLAFGGDGTPMGQVRRRSADCRR